MVDEAVRWKIIILAMTYDKNDMNINLMQLEISAKVQFAKVVVTFRCNVSSLLFVLQLYPVVSNFDMTNVKTESPLFS